MFDPDVSLAAGGDPNIVYYHSHWAVGEDEALLIEVMPPECEHWNFQLNNYWMESLDYRYHTIHTNKHLAHYEPDGSIRLVVAHRTRAAKLAGHCGPHFGNHVFSLDQGQGSSSTRHSYRECCRACPGLFVIAFATAIPGRVSAG